jgi:hypothetical protein
MHRVTEEWTHRKCGWKHSAKDMEPLPRPPIRAAKSALTNSAFSWKFANNNAPKGTKFIGDSSPLATVVALYNSGRNGRPTLRPS